MWFLVIFLLCIVAILAVMLLQANLKIRDYRLCRKYDSEYERICKECLMNWIHNCFFFAEFKNPQETYDDLKKLADDARRDIYPEDRALVDMYERILKDVKPLWLEKKDETFRI